LILGVGAREKRISVLGGPPEGYGWESLEYGNAVSTRGELP